jgi:electron transfer flavoprotein beta subunit
MEIVVCVKQSYDVQQIKFDPKTKEPILAGAPRKMSDMDRRALECALRIKENVGGSVRTVSLGTPETRDVVKEIYAMGADSAYLLTDLSLAKADPDITARLLAEMIKKSGDFNLILCGSASTDGYSWQVPAKISKLLNIPFLPNAISLEVDDTAVAECDLGDAIYKLKAPLPCVVSVSLEINEPRIPTLSAILKASRKQFHEFHIKDFEVDLTPELEVVSTRMPEVSRKNFMVDVSDASKLDEVKKVIDELRKENVL